MKKNASVYSKFQNLISLLILCTLFSTLKAQSPYDPYEFLISFDPSTSAVDIANLKQFYNATEDPNISPSSYSNIHLWRVISFPAGNNSLNDINEIIGDARTRAEVNSVGFYLVRVLCGSCERIVMGDDKSAIFD